jgi:hypothetical protein
MGDMCCRRQPRISSVRRTFLSDQETDFGIEGVVVQVDTVGRGPMVGGHLRGLRAQPGRRGGANNGCKSGRRASGWASISNSIISPHVFYLFPYAQVTKEPPKTESPFFVFVLAAKKSVSVRFNCVHVRLHFKLWLIQKLFFSVHSAKKGTDSPDYSEEVFFQCNSLPKVLSKKSAINSIWPSSNLQQDGTRMNSMETIYEDLAQKNFRVKKSNNLD